MKITINKIEIINNIILFNYLISIPLYFKGTISLYLTIALFVLAIISSIYNTKNNKKITNTLLTDTWFIIFICYILGYCSGTILIVFSCIILFLIVLIIAIYIWANLILRR